MDVTATFQLTPREFRSALRNLPVLRRMRVLAVLIALVGGIVTATGGHDGWTPLGTGLVLLVFGELGVVRLGTRRSAPLIANPWTVRLTDGCYQLETNATTAKVGWSLYREVSEHGGFWYLHQTNRAVSFLPKQAFPEHDAARVAAFFAARLPKLPRPWYRRVLLLG
ncbi:YcxB family protein [Kitasatospora sp. NPDC006697]|uniref:YcxB family protein n=1 Tax=Kitasatospora sp. NPDC006697 TaxID=3364020 RepID=UPI0036A73E69